MSRARLSVQRRSTRPLRSHHVSIQHHPPPGSWCQFLQSRSIFAQSRTFPLVTRRPALSTQLKHFLFMGPELCHPPPAFIPSYCVFGQCWAEWTGPALAPEWSLVVVTVRAKSQRFGNLWCFVTSPFLKLGSLTGTFLGDGGEQRGPCVGSGAGLRLQAAGSIFWDFLTAFVCFPSTSESLSCGTPASIGAKA